MIRKLEEKLYGKVTYLEAAGLSTDEKPTENIATGSSFIEVDTGKVYMYDEESGTWYEFGAQSEDPDDA